MELQDWPDEAVAPELRDVLVPRLEDARFAEDVIRAAAKLYPGANRPRVVRPPQDAIAVLAERLLDAALLQELARQEEPPLVPLAQKALRPGLLRPKREQRAAEQLPASLQEELPPEQADERQVQEQEQELPVARRRRSFALQAARALLQLAPLVQALPERGDGLRPLLQLLSPCVRIPRVLPRQPPTSGVLVPFPQLLR